MDNIALGKRIREARLKNGLTQEQLAERADIAIYYLGEIERGVKTPSLRVFVALAEALNVSADLLLYDSIISYDVCRDGALAERMEKLTPKQRAFALEILDSYIKAVNN